jgi:hypothetical protein
MRPNINSLIKICNILDKVGEFKISDNLFLKISYYYPDQSDYTGERKVDYEDIEQELTSDDKLSSTQEWEVSVEIACHRGTNPSSVLQKLLHCFQSHSALYEKYFNEIQSANYVDTALYDRLKSK